MKKNKNIFSSLKKYSDKIAIIDTNFKKIKYKQLISDAKKIEKNFKSKELIAIFSENSYEFIVSLVASIQSNQTLILLNPEMNQKDLNNLINTYSPHLFFGQNKILNNSYKEIKKFRSYRLYKIIKPKKFNILPKLSCLLSTSGTTGDIKYVKISNENLFKNTSDIARVLRINSNDVAITTMPPFYSYALSIINTHLFKGGKIILNNYSMIDRKFSEIFNKLKPTNINGVPYNFEILDRIKFNNMKLKNLKFITQAGGKLNDKIKNNLIDICNKNKIKLFIMYGQTEASPRISIMPWPLLKKFPDSVGYPFAGSKVYIKNKFQHNKKKIGEIIYKGKNVFLGYSSSFKDLYKEDEQKNILNTGDIGYVDKNGLIYILGRKKRILKIFGIRISLDYIENELKKYGFYSLCNGDDRKLNVYAKFKSHRNSESMKKLIFAIKSITKLSTKYFKIFQIREFKRNTIGKILYK